MAKKSNAIYEPGELNRVRSKLGDVDMNEAKRMAQILGGDVGTEKHTEFQPIVKGNKHDTVDLTIPGRSRKRPRHNIELIGEGETNEEQPDLAKVINMTSADDPSVTLKTPYIERVKMDRYASQFDFEIKNAIQVLVSMLTFFGEPVDYVNSRFVSRRMDKYYKKVEQLVTATRGLFPRQNAKRSERLKKASPYVYSIMDVIRFWDTERIAEGLTKIQAHPRAVRVNELADIVRSIYKPLFILEKLNIDTHIKGSYKLLYKILYIDNPTESLEKNQTLVRSAMTAFADLRREVHYGMYPLLMKFISDRWFPYEQLFVARRNRFMAFIGVTEDDQIKPMNINPDQMESGGLDEAAATTDASSPLAEKVEEIPSEDLSLGSELETAQDVDKVAQKTQAHKNVEEAEQKKLEHSLGVMEALFPQAGWDQLQDYPDLYPYFVSLYDMRRGYELIAPNDPLQQVAVLMHIMDDLCVGLRCVKFSTVNGSDGIPYQVEDAIGNIITNWRRDIDGSFVKEYLPRLVDYCRMIEHTPEAKTSAYAKRSINEIKWTRRLYFLPYYKFDSIGLPPFQKQDTIAVYGQVKTLRRNLTIVASGIEHGIRTGGAAAKAPCKGIENPWAQYRFEVPNPVSKRLNILLTPDKQNNTSLIFFALSALTVLDNLINTESSWAYFDNSVTVFRSKNNEGIVPVFGIDEKLDADKIFKETIKRKREQQQQKT